MALEAGRVGVRNDQVDVHGRIKEIDADNIFASDEFEFSTDDADFGTKAKIKINAAIDTDALAQKIMAIMSHR